MLREHRARVHNTGAKTARSAAAEPGEGPNSRAVRPQEKKAAVGGIAPRAQKRKPTVHLSTTDTYSEASSVGHCSDPDEFGENDSWSEGYVSSVSSNLHRLK